jgi:hypothetical protein
VRKSSYQLFIEIVLFSILLLTLIQLSKSTLSFLVRHSDNAQTGKVNLIMKHAIDPEVVLFGSSVAEVGFNSNKITELTGHTFYNAAIDGTKIGQNIYLVEEFNSYAKHNKIIILGLSFFSLTKVDALTEPSRYYAHLGTTTIDNMFQEIDRKNYWKLKYLPFYSFTQYKHTYYKNGVIGAINLLSNSKLENDTLNGFVAHDSRWYGEEIDSVMFGTNYINYDEAAITKINKLILDVIRKHRTLIIVISPLFINAQKSFANFEEYKEKIMGFESYGARVIDLSGLLLNYDRSYFYNNGHLNINGANLASRILADSLKSTSFLGN